MIIHSQQRRHFGAGRRTRQRRAGITSVFGTRRLAAPPVAVVN